MFLLLVVFIPRYREICKSSNAAHHAPSHSCSVLPSALRNHLDILLIQLLRQLSQHLLLHPLLESRHHGGPSRQHYVEQQVRLYVIVAHLDRIEYHLNEAFFVRFNVRAQRDHVFDSLRSKNCFCGDEADVFVHLDDLFVGEFVRPFLFIQRVLCAL